MIAVLKKIAFIFFLFCPISLLAQNIPQHISYYRIYDFIDELAIDKIININSVSKPYSRDFIAKKLIEAQSKDSLLTKRQKVDLKFFLNDYAIELDTLPKSYVHWTNKRTFDLALLQPAFQYQDKNFKCRITPILGMDIIANTANKVIKITSSILCFTFEEYLLSTCFFIIVIILSIPLLFKSFAVSSEFLP